MSELQRNMVDYFVISVNEFAAHYGLKPNDAFSYLKEYKGLQFLNEYYDVQHTLSFADTIENLSII